MTNARHLVLVALDDRQYALPLSAVERVVRLVEITPLPEAPDTVLGVINVQGRIVPALSLRRCLHLPERALRLSDQLIIARIAQRTVALVADAVIDVVEPTERAVTAAPAILSDIELVDGVVKLADALVPLLNLDALFLPDGFSPRVGTQRAPFETAPEETGPPQGERLNYVNDTLPTARPEEPPSSGGVSKDAHWDLDPPEAPR